METPGLKPGYITAFFEGLKAHASTVLRPRGRPFRCHGRPSRNSLPSFLPFVPQDRAGGAYIEAAASDSHRSLSKPRKNLRGAALFASFAKGARGNRPIPHPPLTLSSEFAALDPSFASAL
jgi:hypothetical protein